MPSCLRFHIAMGKGTVTSSVGLVVMTCHPTIKRCEHVNNE